MIEVFSQSQSEISEKEFVQQQIKKDLSILKSKVGSEEEQKELSFYEKKADNVEYNIDIVKKYLMLVKDKERSELNKKGYGARILAIQIALEFLGQKNKKSNQYDTGKIDGILGEHTKQAVKNFQTDYEVKNKKGQIDGLPGTLTINALLTQLEEKRSQSEESTTNPVTNDTPPTDQPTNQTTDQFPTTETSSPASETTPPSTDQLSTEFFSSIKQKMYAGDFSESILQMKEGKYVLRDRLEQQDENGKKFIVIQGQKFYENAENGLGYRVAEIGGLTSFMLGEFSTQKSTTNDMLGESSFIATNMEKGIQILKIGDMNAECLLDKDNVIMKIPLNNTKYIIETENNRGKDKIPAFMDLTIITKKNSVFKGRYDNKQLEQIKGNTSLLAALSSSLASPVPLQQKNPQDIQPLFPSYYEETNHTQYHTDYQTIKTDFVHLSDKERKKARKTLPKNQRKEIEKERKAKKKRSVDNTTITSIEHPQQGIMEESFKKYQHSFECEGSYTFGDDGTTIQGKFLLNSIVEANGKPINPPISFDSLDDMTPTQRKTALSL